MIQKNQNAAFLILRLGLAAVFIWFGASQLLSPSQWTSFLPSWVAAVQFPVVTFVLLNGLFEIIAGVLLALGAWTRIAAFILAVHLVGIAFSIGYNSVAVRDIGLALATLALAVGGAGSYSIDEKSASL